MVDEKESVNVSLPFDARRRDLVARAENLIHEKALDELASGDPLDAGVLGWASNLLREIRVLAEIEVAHPEGVHGRARTTKAGAVAKPQKTKAPGLPKVKHVYGPAGLCLVDHDGSGSCGKLRERQPRKGSEAAVVVEDTRTMQIPGTEGAA